MRKSSSIDATQHTASKSRQLGNGNGNAFNTLPVSALSWRYLGMFIDSDCNNKNRKLWNNYNNYNTACRKVLWAAYYDPEYEGEGIAEYSFYDRSTGRYDTSTCEPDTKGYYWPGTRCRRLDCHEAGTTLELVGVFKETDGLDDFAEQLFKHQGYCLWDGDKKSGGDDRNQQNGMSNYEFMQNQRKNWVTKCTRLGTKDKKGNPLYYDTKPLPGGDLTYGVYTDSSCTVESKLSWSNILSTNYAKYENQYNNGLPSMDTLDRFNELLSDYKVCQPCRAYNRIQTDSPTGQTDNEGGGDGEGGMDPWGYNCYDDAGYQNCNQCYKFQSQTDMEFASTSDLELATAQGTILGIVVDGIAYGKGQYVTRKSGTHPVRRSLATVFKISALVVFVVFCLKLLTAMTAKGLQKRRRRVEPNIPYYTSHARPRSKKQKKSLRSNGPVDLDEAILDYEKRHRSTKERNERRDHNKRGKPLNGDRSKSQSRSNSRPSRPGKLSLSISSEYSEF